MERAVTSGNWLADEGSAKKKTGDRGRGLTSGLNKFQQSMIMLREQTSGKHRVSTRQSVTGMTKPLEEFVLAFSLSPEGRGSG